MIISFSIPNVIYFFFFFPLFFLLKYLLLRFSVRFLLHLYCLLILIFLNFISFSSYLFLQSNSVNKNNFITVMCEPEISILLLKACHVRMITWCFWIIFSDCPKCSHVFMFGNWMFQSCTGSNRSHLILFHLCVYTVFSLGHFFACCCWGGIQLKN